MKYFEKGLLICILVLESLPVRAGAEPGLVEFFADPDPAPIARRIAVDGEVLFATECPTGFEVIGGGYRILSVEGGPKTAVSVLEAYPDVVNRRYKTLLTQTTIDTGGAAPLVTAQILPVCAKTSPLPGAGNSETVFATKIVRIPAGEMESLSVQCPSPEKATGGGFLISGGNDWIKPTGAFPLQNGTSYRADFISTRNGQATNTELTAFAICS